MEHTQRRVVVGVDGSAGSRAALRYALEDAARRGAAVEVVGAFAVPDYWAGYYALPPESVEQIQDGLRAQTRQVVDEVVRDLPAAPPVGVTIVPGPAAQALVAAADGADLLVLGNRGRGGFASMLLGSVSLQCAMHAPCPVTIVRTPRAGAAERAGAPAEAAHA
ncbi:hypothetical protein BJF78_15370 [Pseudonocardia sp. CNS-139]|nr:hypothetical protein BJF78_15370 [Pseudonocardia sp. CNS-139]